MNRPSLYNVYCDESCHTEKDGIPVMAWGAVAYKMPFVWELSKEIRRLKAEYGLSSSDFEAKWTKVSPGQVEFYLALVDLFLANDQLRFRGIVVPDKSLLNHAAFEQSHDDWYYKMYFRMLHPTINRANRYRIYLDIKDTRGGPKARKLHEVLASSLRDPNHECIERVQQVHSHEIELLQIADILTGALTYANRGLTGNAAKLAIIARLREQLGPNVLNQTTPRASTKFNILVWKAQRPLNEAA